MTYVDLSKLLFRTQYGREHEIDGPGDDPEQVVNTSSNMESGEFLYRLRDTKDGYELVSNSNQRDYRDDLVPSIEKNHRRDVLVACSEYVAVVRPDVGRFVLFTVTSGTKTEYYVVNEYFVPDIEAAAEIKFTLTPLTFKSRLDAMISLRQLLTGMITGLLFSWFF
ncbi:hypothetical protein AAVH_25316 [Aphelenchoides avenae]|nr:hypothetical protein AAVH_25316 [Aphelenchus avenae]